MSGSNGLSPVATLADRQKCPEAPTKRKYKTTDEAWAAARERSAETHLDIAPYACPGCGYYHLTKKVTGSDVLTRQDGGKVVTGAQRRSNHPVFAPAVERATLEPAAPPIPGDRSTRTRVARSLLAVNPEPTTGDVRAALHCSTETARSIMRDLGYECSKGRSARWRKAGMEAATVDEPEVGEEEWDTLDLDRVAHVAVGDLIEAYRLAGVEFRIQVRRG
ncbi:hypothetical protein [Microbacterium phage MO526]|uniref:Helix-turn-helix DNA binding domain protein n=1 Tax=Microbacterium phage MO526 TaxID=3108092 RepID=A0ABZ0ZX27_9CAUD|nr:hypothetical protein [Microbacterium phage MO526]